MLGIQPQHTAGQHTPQTVYNLEVQGQHVFRVTSNGLLVHNSYGNAPRGPVGDLMIDTGVMRNFVVEGSNMRHAQKAVVGNRRMFATQTAVDEFRAAMVRTGSIQEQLRANRLINRLTVVPDNPSASFSALTPSRRMGANDIGIFGTADRLGMEILTTDKTFMRTFYNRTGQTINGQWFAPYVLPGP